MGGRRDIFFGSSRPWARPWTALVCPTPFFPAASPVMTGCGKLQAARRGFVALMKRLAKTYAAPLALTRDSTDALLLRAYRNLLLKVLPDKGGAVAHQQAPQDAKETWQSAKNARASAGRPPSAPPRSPSAERTPPAVYARAIRAAPSLGLPNL